MNNNGIRNDILTNLDNTFLGAQQAMSTGHKILGAISEGFNNFQQMTDSRRGMGGNQNNPYNMNQQQNQQCQQYQQYQYNQPLPYGYGYDNNQNGGYLYQSYDYGSNNGIPLYQYQNDMYQNPNYNPNMNPNMMQGGYAGFSNPNYGNNNGGNMGGMY